MATPKSAKKSKSGSSKKNAGTKNLQSKRAGLTMPVAKIGRFLRTRNYTGRVSATSAVFIAGALEFLTSEVISAAKKVAKKERITPRAITLAVRDDEEMNSLLSNVVIARGGVLVTGTGKKEKKEKKAKKGKKAAKKSEGKKSKKSSGSAKKSKKGGKKGKKSSPKKE